ncbi:MAG: hypothetical protein K8R75_07470 [Deltaproteobacteria bacterium]|nr:hypothetical protein [Deltaproteobacteria bacterium]
MDKLLILTGSDGSSAQLAGLELLLHSFSEVGLNNNKYQFVLLCPSWTDRKAFLNFSKKYGCVSESVSLVKTNDKYYVKFVIQRYLLSNSFNDVSGILYLDFDHICLRSINLPELHEDIVFVSSEVTPLVEMLGSANIPRILWGLNGKHYNNSIIWAVPETFKKVAKRWSAAYRRLSSAIPLRYLEEVAFSLAAFEAGCTLVPVSPTVQGNWHIGVLDCSMFHYGGEHPLAEATKSSLNGDLIPKKIEHILSPWPRNLQELSKKIVTLARDLCSK